MKDIVPQQTMAIAAVGLHELYQSYLRAGFTPEQAFDLVKVALTVSIQNGRSDG